MSWSISAIGKPAAVASKVAAELAANKCNEPEETIKSLVGQAISTALGAMPDSYAVKLAANGSQSGEYKNGEYTGKFVNNLSVSIEPIYGFVE